jgi:hypothetical protein
LAINFEKGVLSASTFTSSIAQEEDKKEVKRNKTDKNLTNNIPFSYSTRFNIEYDIQSFGFNYLY